ncbi:FAD-dependent monooxygenase [Spirosoma spitsbergense]|uniref:FAD-dependent monooxygenase n=1 Tax=Spirosoma spitsbergense TaxID=431554 RepID=UPI00037DD873|nr:FAD-dependent monooxygenase [Spirosoma spitsbergense]
MNTQPAFAILGGGIAGLTTAIALQRIGIRATLFEAAPDVKPVGAGLALAANAIQAFQRLGMADRVIASGRQLDAFSILDEWGKAITRSDSRAISQRYGVNNFAIHRAELHRVLLESIDSDIVQTGKRAVRIVQEPDSVTIFFDDETSYQTPYLLVADGIHSLIRQQLVPKSVPRYAGYTCWRAVVRQPGSILHEATETWGSRGRVGIVPLANEQVYWFACVNAPAQHKPMRQLTPYDLADRFKHYHAPIPELLAQTPGENLLWNDIIDLKPLSRYAFGRVLLLGDAAHATTPNMGQGACQAIEDAVVLADELARGQLVEEAFAGFERRRLARTHYITTTSRRIGQVAQITNPLFTMLRNGLFRRLPDRINERQLEQLYQVNF